jgi:hypothetical protein
MNFAEICGSAYLIVGGLAAGLIWTALMASKRHEANEENVGYNSVEYNPFRERRTKPSRSL